MMTNASAGASDRGWISSHSDWIVLLEDLLRGVVHASNNRFTALMSLTQLAEQDGESPEDAALMRQELARLHEVVSFVGVLVARSDQPEALEVHTLLGVALEIHAMHPRMRMMECVVTRGENVPPVRVPRTALLRLLLLMVDAAKLAATADALKSSALYLDATETLVRLRTAALARPGSDAMELAASCGGEIRTADREWTLELPSLAAIRQRERAATTPTPAADA